MILKNVTTGNLFIRKQPNLKAPILGRLMTGAEVTVDPLYATIADGVRWVKVAGEEKYIAQGTVKRLIVLDDVYLASREPQASVQFWLDAEVTTEIREVK